MTEKTKIKNRERARKWYKDNRQRKLDYERERLNKGKILQERIDKAIEYIEETWKKESYYEDIENCVEFATINDIQKNRLLNLLKGDNK